MTSTQLTVHESTYRALKEQILFGGLPPKKAVTIRGLAEALNVSPTPIREAVRRLIAERALEMHDNRRVSIPEMTMPRYQEIRIARLLIEPELSALATPYITHAIQDEMRQLDDHIDECMSNGDIEGYMRYNYQFHFILYNGTNSNVMKGLANSLWMQYGPFMRQVYGRMGTNNLEEDHHKLILDGLKQQDPALVRHAITQDITLGMSHIDIVHQTTHT